MKKLTLSIGLLAAIMTSNAQDTLKYVIDTKQSYEFEACDKVLHLHLNDKKNRLREVLLFYPDGEVYRHIFDSKDNYYLFEKNVKVIVSKPKFMFKL